ncbi:hypothetical protein OG730_42125 (plasmid) [Streptomyces sp. NBC_01298]|uniref:DUF6875 domain-containing protein n=1 Tax=Streptomyces sp. NBC_01298 TaxID=2903817 RepID=UPI002E128F9F|nr:hypothetical protein OG730_42125 [Streptomyces sp. NBC_01298]
MTRSPTAQSFDLLTPAEIDELPASPDADALKKMLAWVRDFIAKPNPERDRENPDSPTAVCRFMPKSLTMGLTWFTVAKGPIAAPDDVIRVVDAYKAPLSALEPTSGSDAKYKTIIVVFPAVTQQMAPQFIDGTHARASGEYKADALMLGEFHADSQKRGSHNPAFFPLRSPVPAMAIRFMVALDHVFLTKGTGNPMEDLKDLQAYTDAFSSMEPPPSEKVQEMAKILLGQLEVMARRATEVPPDTEDGLLA